MNNYTPKEDNYIRENYGLLKYSEMAATLGNGNAQSVKQRARKLEMGMVRPGTSKFSRRKRIYEIDDNFFSTPNNINCYWAGFIAADGCIREEKNELTIGLAEKDKEHLERFLLDTEANIPIYQGLYAGIYPWVKIRISSPQIILDLEKNFSITPRKTYTLQPPKIEDVDLIKCYIAGFIDGDGSAGFTKAKSTIEHTYPYISIVGASNYIFGWLEEHLQKIVGITHRILYKDRKNGYMITLQRFDALKLAEKLLELPIPLMERKLGKFRDLPKDRVVGRTAAGVAKRNPVRVIKPETIPLILEDIKAGDITLAKIGIKYGVSGARIGQIKKQYGR